AREAAMVWVDVLEPDEASMGALAKEFGLHPLAVEDCLHYPQRPKIDFYPNTVFLIWLGPDGGSDAYRGSFTEVDLFIGKGFLVTVHHEPLSAVEQVGADASCCLLGPEWAAHAILDRLVDALLPQVEEVA